MSLAWPVMLEQVMASLTQIVDMVMIGHLGPVAVAGIGLSFQPFFFVFAVFSGLAVGTTALVARHTGAGRGEEAGHVAAQSVLVALLLGLALLIPGYVFADDLVRLMGAEPDVVQVGAVYIRFIVPGGVFMLLAMLLGGALRGAGDTQTPMRVGILINISNVVLNYVLIFGRLGFPALGVKGAAIATSVSRASGGLILLGLVIAGRAGLSFRAASLRRLDFPVIRRTLAVGVPAAGERIIMGGAQILYARIVASLGTVAYAAHAIAMNAESVAYMPAMGFATAASTTVGQSLGSDRPETAERYGWECGRTAMVFMGAMGLVLLAIPHLLMRLYTTDPEVIRLGSICLRIMGPAQVAQAAGFVFGGALRGAGDTRRVMYITIAGVWTGRLGLCALLILRLGVGLGGAWIAMASDWVIRSSLLIARFRGGAWKRVRV